jgi:hypothetical protein
MKKITSILTLILALSTGFDGARAADVPVTLLPMTCAELLPDLAPYLGFFETVARGQVGQDRVMSRRLFRVLALRERLSDQPERMREPNPVDMLIRRTLCFYREQKEPLRQITNVDEEFLKLR